MENESSISPQAWRSGEIVADKILSLIRPTMGTKLRRENVIKFLHNLITPKIKCKVVPYGSFPLKTYLPDGDIDLTLITENSDDVYLGLAVVDILKTAEADTDSEHQVKDIKYIDAKVKIVKCHVDGIDVDLSFNQLSGIYSLSFIEKIDRAIQHNHILKRSILLIKAWCLYQGHIIGGQHGLITTYTLEILLLHLFKCHYLADSGPLEVFYRFMNYFGNFAWDKYCVSVNGPALREFLPDVVVESQRDRGIETTLDEEFLKSCVDMFSVPSNSDHKVHRQFSRSDLNIIDPLNPSNNLGRNICKSQQIRICAAFRFAASHLASALKFPIREIKFEIEHIFQNTIMINRVPTYRPSRFVFSASDLSVLLVPSSNSQHGKTNCFHDEEAQSSLERILDDLTGDLRHVQHCIQPPRPTPFTHRGPVSHDYFQNLASAPPPLQWSPNNHMNRIGSCMVPAVQWGQNVFARPIPRWCPTPQMVRSNAYIAGPSMSVGSYRPKYRPRANRTTPTFFCNPNSYRGPVPTMRPPMHLSTGSERPRGQNGEILLSLNDENDFPPFPRC